MRYFVSYRCTPQGVEYMEYKMDHWYHFSTCPECGKKLQPVNAIIMPHTYVCRDCYDTNERYHNAVENENNLRYERSCLKARA